MDVHPVTNAQFRAFVEREHLDASIGHEPLKLRDRLYHHQSSLESVSYVADLELSNLIGHELYETDLSRQDDVVKPVERLYCKLVDVLSVELRQVQLDRDILDYLDRLREESGGRVVLDYRELLESLRRNRGRRIDRRRGLSGRRGVAARLVGIPVGASMTIGW